MLATPASVERVEIFVFNFEIYRFLKKGPVYPISLSKLSDIECTDYLPTWVSKAGGGGRNDGGCVPVDESTGDVPLGI